MTKKTQNFISLMREFTLLRVSLLREFTVVRIANRVFLHEAVDAKLVMKRRGFLLVLVVLKVSCDRHTLGIGG